MKRLFPALLICLSLQVQGKDFNYTDPIDLIGTPLQQDFKLLYREALQAAILGADEEILAKELSWEGRARAKKFLEHSLFKAEHPCREIELHPHVTTRPRENNEDQVNIWFLCADGSHRNLNQSAVLFLRIRNGAYRYLVQFYWKRRPANSIWDD